MNLLYKILRGTAQATVIYLLLRYLPYLELGANKALITTIIIIVLFLVLEQLITMYNGISNTAEHFSGSTGTPGFNCACAVEGFNGSAEETNHVVTGATGATGAIGATGATASTEEALTTQQPMTPMPPTPPQNNGDIVKAVDQPNSTSLGDIPVKQSANDDRFYWGSRYGNMGYDDRYGFGGMFYDEYPFYNRFRNHDFQNLENTGAKYPLQENGQEAAMLDARREKMERDKIEENAHSTAGYASRYQEVGSRSEKLRTTDNNRRIEGPLDYEIPYTDYNHLPVAAGYKSSDYEYGMSFLPPEKWYPNPPRPPICVTEKRCPVCPGYTNSSVADLKEFHTAARITPPDLISSDYIGDKINSGR
jgi:hypothetical protein